jgi:hypothetical protein
MQASEIRTAILELKTLPLTPLRIPEWPKIDAYLREMRGDVFAAYLDICKKARDEEWKDERFNAEVVVLVLCDSEGNLVFNNGDAASLSESSPAPLRRIWRRVARMNALYEPADRELEGN